MFRILAVLFTIVLSGGAQAQLLADVEMRRSGHGHFLAAVSLNGQGPFTMIVDTGATNTILTAETVEALGLAARDGAAGSAHTATGTVPIAFHALDRIEIGTFSREGLRVMGAGGDVAGYLGEEVDGVIGLDVLGGLVLDFDTPAGRFRLFETAPPAALGEGWAVQSIRQGFAGLTYTRLSLGGAEFDALFDTGASRIIVNDAAIAAAGLRRGDPEFFTPAPPVRGFGGAATPADRMTGAALAWGEMSYPAATVDVSSTPVFDMLRLSGDAAGIAGLPLLGDHRFVVDYPAGAVRVEPARSG